MPGQPYLLPTLFLLMLLSTVAAALAWIALIWFTARGLRPDVGSAPRSARGTRWLVAGALIIPTVAFGASTIALLSSPGLPLPGP